MINPEVNIKYDGPEIPQESENIEKGGRIKPKQIYELFPVQNSAPTGVPESFVDQIRICYVGPFVYLYIYDFSAVTWRRLQF